MIKRKKCKFKFGESDSPSCSVESVLSNMSVVEKDDVADISYGSKGWLMDDASQKCMSCQGTFYYLSNRRHHCRLVSVSVFWLANLCNIMRALEWAWVFGLILARIITCFKSFVSRNCGGIFCSSCSKRTFFRVYENKGGNVRVCNKCYDFMIKAGPHQLFVVTSEMPTTSLTSKRNGGLMAGKPSEATMNGGSVSSTIFG